MKIVSEEFGTALATVPIENGEELYLELWLLVTVWLQSRFLQIENDRDPIFVVVPYQAIVSVCTVGYHVWEQAFLRNFCLFNDWSWRKSLVLGPQDFRV